MSNTFVCLMGIGTVFTGLVCIVLICKLTSIVMKSISKPAEKKPAPVSTPVSANTLSAKEKQAIIAGTCAVIAEELGTDVNNIRVLSFRKV